MRGIFLLLNIADSFSALHTATGRPSNIALMYMDKTGTLSAAALGYTACTVVHASSSLVIFTHNVANMRLAFSIMSCFKFKQEHHFDIIMTRKLVVFIVITCRATS